MGKWDKRVIRANRRLEIGIRDLSNALRWHLLGGRRFFGSYWQELAGSHRWVFIIGCNNSGTSLLQRLLESTGEVSTFRYEGQLYTRALRRDRERQFARVWTEYVDELRVPGDDSLGRAPRLIHDWMSNLPQPIRPVIVEKTPANLTRAEWLQRAFPNSRFIGLVRNGYAVSEGIRRKARQPLDSGARHWSAVNRMMLDTASTLDHYLEVRYEDLAGDPVNTLARIGAFIGIGGENATRGAAPERPVGDVAAISPGSVRDYNAESIARLSAADMATVRANANEMLDYFGYVAPETHTIAEISAALGRESRQMSDRSHRATLQDPDQRSCSSPVSSNRPTYG